MNTELPFNWGIETVWKPIGRLVKSQIDNFTGRTDRKQQQEIDQNTNRSEDNEVRSRHNQHRNTHQQREIDQNTKDIQEIKKLASDLGIDTSKWQQIPNYQNVQSLIDSMNANLAVISGLKNDDGSSLLTNEQQTLIKDALQNLSAASHDVITSDDPKKNLNNPNTELIMNSLGALNSVLKDVGEGNIENPNHLTPLIDKINERAKNLPKGIAQESGKTLVRA